MSDFTVQIIAKPYVKRFIVVNCGDPSDLSGFPQLKELVRKNLRKPVKRYEKKYDTGLRGYTEFIEIIISEDDFYRYGWEISRTDMIKFGREVEMLIKLIMRNYLSIYYIAGIPVKKAIERFQKTFGFDEEHWSYEAIKKDFYRHGRRYKDQLTEDLYKYIKSNIDKTITGINRQIKSNIFRYIDKIFMENLSFLPEQLKDKITLYEDTKQSC